MAPLQPKHHDIYPAIDPSDSSSNLQDSAKHRTVIVTGAGRGIGRSIALNYAKAGASVIVIAARTTTQLDEVERDIQAITPNVKVIKQSCDVTQEASVRDLIATSVAASEPDTPYTLVNNAGFLEPHNVISKSDPATWMKTWSVNINGTYLPTRFLLDHMSPNSKAPHYIINMSSRGSRDIFKGFSAYQPAKTAINRFTAFLAAEHATTHNLVTFAVHPGGVWTDLAKNGMPPEARSMFIDTPELMGGFSVWLGSGKCDWANGRYLECYWDVEDILQKREEVEKGDLWKTVVVM